MSVSVTPLPPRYAEAAVLPRSRVYLAGPDVFLRDVSGRFEALRAACSELGLEGLPPEEGSSPLGTPHSPRELAHHIYRGNVQRIRDCDAVLANLMPFRSPVEPDPGTVFEIGYAVALGKPVAGYFPQANELYQDRIRAAFGATFEEGRAFDSTYGMLIESLEHPLNLMLACSIPLFTEERAALAYLAQRLRQ